MERKRVFRLAKLTAILTAAVVLYIAGYFHGHISSHLEMTDETFTEAVEKHLRAKEVGAQGMTP